MVVVVVEVVEVVLVLLVLVLVVLVFSAAVALAVVVAFARIVVSSSSSVRCCINVRRCSGSSRNPRTPEPHGRWKCRKRRCRTDGRHGSSIHRKRAMFSSSGDDIDPIEVLISESSVAFVSGIATLLLKWYCRLSQATKGKTPNPWEPKRLARHPKSQTPEPEVGLLMTIAFMRTLFHYAGHYIAHMGGCQNYGPFWGPYYNTAPNI